jgi:di/tricarboxylate transporter
MTPEIAVVLVLLLAAVILFVSERLRPDLVALLVLLAVIMLGLVEPQEAFAQSGRDRFKAVILTTVTTCMGLMPMLLETSN